MQKIGFKPFQTFKAQKTAETINISFFLIIPLKNIEFNSKITVFVSKIYFYRSFLKVSIKVFMRLLFYECDFPASTAFLINTAIAAVNQSV